MELFEYFGPFLSKVCQQLAHHDVPGLGLGPVLRTFCLPKLQFLFTQPSLVRLHHGSPLADTIIIRRTVLSPRLCSNM
jgi:hypothetical protein